MSSRIEDELTLLRGTWPDIEYRKDGRWVLLPSYSMPGTCAQPDAAVCFQIKPGHPGDPPYAFYVRSPISPRGGGGFQRSSPSSEPPFPGEWIKFSWSPEGWRATADPRNGSNMLNFALSFRDRLQEGP